MFLEMLKERNEIILQQNQYIGELEARLKGLDNTGGIQLGTENREGE